MDRGRDRHTDGQRKRNILRLQRTMHLARQCDLRSIEIQPSKHLRHNPDAVKYLPAIATIQNSKNPPIVPHVCSKRQSDNNTHFSVLALICSYPIHIPLYMSQNYHTHLYINKYMPFVISYCVVLSGKPHK